MGLNDLNYLEIITPRRWPAYKEFIESGIRFFGIIKKGFLVSMCGLAYLNYSQSQVIGIETFDQNNKRCGYAKRIASRAVQEGLMDNKYVTWSTSIKNEASCKTAESIGMKPYCSQFELKGIFRKTL